MIRKLFYSGLVLFSMLTTAHAYPKQDAYSHFQITLEDLYLRPNGDFLQYVAVLPPESGTNDVPIRIHKVRPDYSEAFRLGLGFTFPCTNNDMNIYWTHLHTDDSDTVRARGNRVVELPFVLNIGAVFDTGRGKIEFDYDMVDLNVGHYTTFCDCFQTHFYAGLRYVVLRRDFDIRVERTFDLETADGGPILVEVDTDTHANALGPQLGMDAYYYFGRCFGIESNLSIAGVVEDAKTRIKALTRFISNVEVRTSIEPDDQFRVVPVIDAKLGVLYNHQFRCGPKIRISAGYQFVTYIGAFNELAVTSAPQGLNSLDSRKIDATFDGPYLSLSLRM